MGKEEFTKKSEQEGSVVEKNEIIEEDLEFRAEKLKRYLGAARSVLGRFSVHERIIEFAETIKKKYPEDYNKYYAYHALIGSSVKDNITEFDFPGEEVKKFIDQLENEILDKSKE